MIAKYGENSYVDVDSITFISGDYDGGDYRWVTTIVVDGVEERIFGKIGRNIMDSFLWKRQSSVHDMIPSSPGYKKTIKYEGRKQNGIFAESGGNI